MVPNSNTAFPITQSFSAISALPSGASWMSVSPYSLLKGDGPTEPVLSKHFLLNPDSSFT